MLTITFLFSVGRGLNHKRGNANGPTHRSAITKVAILKYHLPFFLSSISPQCLHFIASSCISSAQKGHFFIFLLFFGTLKCALQLLYAAIVCPTILSQRPPYAGRLKPAYSRPLPLFYYICILYRSKI